MTGIRKIVAAANGGPGDVETLTVAAQLGARHGAVVRVVSAFPDAAADLVAMGDGLGGYIGPSTYGLLQEAEREVLAEVAARCRTAAAGAKIAFGDEAGEPAPRLLLTARSPRPWSALAVELVLADLLVLSRGSFGGRSMHMSDILGDALLQSRSPVLVARGDAEKLMGCVCIAWDGSAHAGRAVKSALPFLKQARHVVVLQSRSAIERDDKAGADVDRLLRYLALHGIDRIDRQVVEDGPEGPALVAAAERQGAGLFVAGAYGHSRLQQAVFGGATRVFLEAETGPHLLLAH